MFSWTVTLVPGPTLAVARHWLYRTAANPLSGVAIHMCKTNFGHPWLKLALEFPHKFGNTTVNETISKPTQVVASATRSPKTGRKIQRLTPSEVAIAKKLGVPLDEYAKSKRKITKEV